MTAAESWTLLEVDNLTIAFDGGGAPALAGQSLCLHRNELLGVVGEATPASRCSPGP